MSHADQTVCSTATAFVPPEAISSLYFFLQPQALYPLRRSPSASFDNVQYQLKDFKAFFAPLPCKPHMGMLTPGDLPCYQCTVLQLVALQAPQDMAISFPRVPDRKFWCILSPVWWCIIPPCLWPQKCSLGLGLEEQLGWAPLQLVRNIVCSQESVLSESSCFLQTALETDFSCLNNSPSGTAFL